MNGSMPRGVSCRFCLFSCQCFLLKPPTCWHDRRLKKCLTKISVLFRFFVLLGVYFFSLGRVLLSELDINSIDRSIAPEELLSRSKNVWQLRLPGENEGKLNDIVAEWVSKLAQDTFVSMWLMNDQGILKWCFIGKLKLSPQFHTDLY